MSDTNATQPKPRVSVGEFFKQVGVERRKIVWPSRQETITTSIFVAILMLILSLFFLGVDSVFGWIVKQLLALAS